jgi:hypothetical protein
LFLQAAIQDLSAFVRNQARLIGTDIALEFLKWNILEWVKKTVLSKNLFIVDGTLIQVWTFVKGPGCRDEGERRGFRLARQNGVDMGYDTQKFLATLRTSVPYSIWLTTTRIDDPPFMPAPPASPEAPGSMVWSNSAEREIFRWIKTAETSFAYVGEIHIYDGSWAPYDYVPLRSTDRRKRIVESLGGMIG